MSQNSQIIPKKIQTECYEKYKNKHYLNQNKLKNNYI